MSWYFEVELLLGLAFLATAVILWRYLMRLFRRQPLPLILSFDMAAPMSAVLEVALIAFGLAAIIDVAVRILP